FRSGVFAEELQKARDIRDGKREAAMLPVLYEFLQHVQESRNRDWENPALWPLVTPNLGKSITLERLVSDHREAKETSEQELRIWTSQHLNVQIGMALAAAGWAGAEFWERRADKELTLESLRERSEVCTVGIGGGGLDDLLGLVVLGRERGTRRWLWWARAWAHRIVLERRKEIAEKLLDLERAGDLSVVDVPGDDV